MKQFSLPAGASIYNSNFMNWQGVKFSFYIYIYIYIYFFNFPLFILTLQLKYTISDLPLAYQFHTLILSYLTYVLSGCEFLENEYNADLKISYFF